MRADPAPGPLEAQALPPLFARPESPPTAWRVAPGLTPYAEALSFMEERAGAIAAGEAGELIWLVEHPPLYTAGTSARAAELIDQRFEVHTTGRGGRYTYHGPGQRVVYVMLNLARRRQDVRVFVQQLEAWIIEALADLGVEGMIRDGRVGVWVARPDKPLGRLGQPAEDKIAAIGVRLRRWATFHGLAINVAPDLSHFSGIVPCGLAEAHLGVTSLQDLGRTASMAGLDLALRRAFERRFGPSVTA